jgi:hypothetical protein
MGPTAPTALMPVLTMSASSPQGVNLALFEGGLNMPVDEAVVHPTRAVSRPAPLAVPVKPIPLPVYPRKQDRN